MNWAEPLPPDCPPKEAYSPNGEIFYRMIEGLVPCQEDFHSERKRNPQRKISDECIARAVSLFDTIESCKQLRLLPYHRNRFSGKPMAEIILDADCGVISQTGKNPHHFSWWLVEGYDPLQFSNVIPD